MTSTISWIIGIAVPAVITTIIAIILQHYFKKYYDKKDADEKEYREQMAALDKYREEERNTLLAATIEQSIAKEIQPIKDDLELLKRGNQASLRHNLYEVYDYWAPKGYCPRDKKADFENLYQSYHALGKNGVMDGCYADLMDLPDEEPKKSRKTK